MRKELFCTLAVLAGSQLANAQWTPPAMNYSYPGYYPGMAMSAPSYGYPGYPTYPGYPGYTGYPGYPAGWGVQRPVPVYPGYGTYPYGYGYYPGWGGVRPANPQAASNVIPVPTKAPQTPGAITKTSTASAAPRPPATAAAPAKLPAGTAVAQAAPAKPGAAPVAAPAAPIPQVLPMPKSGPQDAGLLEGVDVKGWFHDLMGNPGDPACRRVWASADYLFAWIKPGPLGVPLVTTGDPADLHPGAIGQPGTAVLFGNNNLNFPMSPGFRAEAGLFLDDQSRFSLDGAGFLLFPHQIKFSANSDPLGNPVLARPVFLAAPPPGEAAPREGEYQVAFPGSFMGGSMVNATTHLFSIEANGRYHYYSGRFHGSFIAGFRTLRLNEDLTIRDAIVPLAPATVTFLGNFIDPPQALSDFDQFSTSNRFYGLQLGHQLAYEGDWFYASIFGKIAGGVNDQKMLINGATTLVDPVSGQNQSTPGGILAQPTNIGQRKQSIFSFVPEVGVQIGVEPIKHVRLTAGYTALFWTQVVRPGTLIDRSVNPFQVPGDPAYGLFSGPARPAFTYSEQLFWMQAITLGLQFYY